MEKEPLPVKVADSGTINANAEDCKCLENKIYIILCRI
jgi:hypothetical protein